MLRFILYVVLNLKLTSLYGSVLSGNAFKLPPTFIILPGFGNADIDYSQSRISNKLSFKESLEIRGYDVEIVPIKRCFKFI